MHSIDQATFSNDERFIATVGLDAHHRVQITVWSVEALIAMKNTGISHKCVVAKQTSDFPIHKIKFSPLDSQVILQIKAMPWTTVVTDFHCFVLFYFS